MLSTYSNLVSGFSIFQHSHTPILQNSSLYLIDTIVNLT
jgi:hypothetical protein